MSLFVSVTAAWRRARMGATAPATTCGTGPGRAGHRRRHRRAQPHVAARGDYCQWPHARGPDREKAENLGELVLTLEGGALTVESYRLFPIRRQHHSAIAPSPARSTSSRTSTPGGVRIPRLQRGSAAGGDAAGPAQHLHRHRGRHAARQPLHRRLRKATQADIGFTANGMMRAGLTRGKSGVQTVYDVFAVRRRWAPASWIPRRAARS